MTTDNPLPTPPSVTPTPASGAATASGSQTTDPAAAVAPGATGEQTPPTAQQQQQQQQTQPSAAEAIEALVQQILASNNEATLAGTLLNSLGTPDLRESILSSLTPAGADPLDALDVAQHTIGTLFILCVLVSLLLSPPPLPRSTRYCPLSRWNAVCEEHRCVFHGCVSWMCLWLALSCRYLALAG